MDLQSHKTRFCCPGDILKYMRNTFVDPEFCIERYWFMNYQHNYHYDEHPDFLKKKKELADKVSIKC